ncbi:hypothetical protein HAX54_013016, partial [Datura stramonium]|nr:hypothetical protein [Datura stramonium]
MVKPRLEIAAASRGRGNLEVVGAGNFSVVLGEGEDGDGERERGRLTAKLFHRYFCDGCSEVGGMAVGGSSGCHRKKWRKRKGSPAAAG